MRCSPFIVPLLLAAAPAAAQPAAKPAPEAEMVIPPELSDPKMLDRLIDVMPVLAKALMNLPVGEIEAALDGRQPTEADRNRRIGDGDPQFERKLQADLAASRGTMQAAGRAVVAALPAMMKGMREAAAELEKATANLPRPDYPKR